MIQLAERLTNKKKQKIIADYVKSQNLRATARQNNVSDYCVKKIVTESKDIEQRIAQNNEQNTLDTLEYLKTQSKIKNRLVGKLLKSMEIKTEDIEKANIKDLAMAYGIIIDKELKLLELQKSQREINNGLDKVQQLLDEIQKEANR